LRQGQAVPADRLNSPVAGDLGNEHELVAAGDQLSEAESRGTKCRLRQLALDPLLQRWSGLK
jgi:hypothetical protein